MWQVPSEALLDYLLGGLHYTATNWREADARFHDRVWHWWSHLAGSGFDHLPLAMIMDLGKILSDGPEVSFPAPAVASASPAERLCARWQHEFLDPLAKHPLFVDAWESLQQGNRRAAQEEHLLRLILRTFARHFPPYAVVSPASARRLLGTLPGEPPDHATCAEAAQRTAQRAPVAELYPRQIEEFLEAVAIRVQWSRLLTEEDFFELRHLPALHSEFLRIGCRQLIQFDRQLGPFDRRRIQLPAEPPDAETSFRDESSYPAGGFAGLTNRGSMENLVLSELVYMQPEEAVNLFELRFVEGELLYFTRDEGLLHRQRRTLHVVIDLGAAFHKRLAGYDYQFAVIAQGLALRLFRDLTAIFQEDSVHTRISIASRDLDPQPFRDEARMLELLLADELEHGWARIEVTPDVSWTSFTTTDRKPYLIVICDRLQWPAWELKLRELVAADSRVQCGVVLVAGNSPDAHPAPAFPLWSLDEHGASQTELKALRDSLLLQIVGGSDGPAESG